MLGAYSSLHPAQFCVEISQHNPSMHPHDTAQARPDGAPVDERISSLPDSEMPLSGASCSQPRTSWLDCSNLTQKSFMRTFEKPAIPERQVHMKSRSVSIPEAFPRPLPNQQWVTWTKRLEGPSSSELAPHASGYGRSHHKS